MDGLLKKLNIKDQKTFTVINAPQDLMPMLQERGHFIPVVNTLNPTQKVEAALIFVTKLEEVQNYAAQVHPLLVEDALLWFAYPKGSSKKYKCEFNRDNGWATLGSLGYEGVRMVAVDADWSALRFRQVKHIKTLNRDPSWIMSKEGKNKVK